MINKHPAAVSIFPQRYTVQQHKHEFTSKEIHGSCVFTDKIIYLALPEILQLIRADKLKQTIKSEESLIQKENRLNMLVIAKLKRPLLSKQRTHSASRAGLLTE